MKGKIAVVGHTDLGRTCADHLQKKGIGVVLVEPPEPHFERVIHHDPDLIAVAHNPNQFHVNGVVYEPIGTETRSGKGSRTMNKMLAMASMFGGIAAMSSMGHGSGYERKLPQGTDIVQEFNLIQQKKSRLSRWERDTVVRIFHQNFRPVKQ